MNDSDCTHRWRRVAGGMQCVHCNWTVSDGGPLPQKGLGIGKFEFKEEDEGEGAPTRRYVDQD